MLFFKKLFSAFIIILLFLPGYTQNQTVGWFLNDSTKSFKGYTLFAPITYNKTYLIDNCGKEIHNWTSNYTSSAGVYLLEDGTLLRSGKILNPNFIIGGQGGIIEQCDWNSNLIWSYRIESDTVTSHHDFKYLPDGNILLLIWKHFLKNELVELGRNPDITGDDMSMEEIWEIKPVGNNSAEIIWKWKAENHLIQNFDNTKPNYGNPADHPELINFNYIGTGPPERSWLHFNSIDFDEIRNQILISVRNFNEIWIIDHSTTSEEAAKHSGGNSEKGGDILFRWGNPAAYNRGSIENQKLFSQHNAHRIPSELPENNKIMIFNNGLNRPGNDYTSVDFIEPETDINGNYILGTDNTFLPDTFYRIVTLSNPTDLFSGAMGSAQMLPNGNILICEANTGRILETEPNNSEIVFEYINPVDNNGPVSQGTVLNGTNSVFSTLKYNPDYAGFTGHNLVVGDPIELNPLNYNCGPEGFSGFFHSISNIRTLKLFPNPAKSSFKITDFSKNQFVYKIIISDILGNIYLDDYRKSDDQIEISNLKNGFYIVKLFIGQKEYSEKLIINR